MLHTSKIILTYFPQNKYWVQRSSSLQCGCKTTAGWRGTPHHSHYLDNRHSQSITSALHPRSTESAGTLVEPSHITVFPHLFLSVVNCAMSVHGHTFIIILITYSQSYSNHPHHHYYQYQYHNCLCTECTPLRLG